uniref:Immunoglobulin V-set domain-containing protein n=1 Tax=Salvator merianae TaxID=96440 RepID=A0A8D0BF18_SALMN
MDFLYHHIGLLAPLKGPAYTWRETTVDSNCSLHITSLTHGDSGIYTVEISGDGLNTIGKTNFSGHTSLTSARHSLTTINPGFHGPDWFLPAAFVPMLESARFPCSVLMKLPVQHD